MLQKDKYRPRTRHLLVKLHHFREYEDRFRSKNQQAEYLTKPVGEEILVKLRRLVQGW